MALPDAHPAFRAHFTDPVYDDQGADAGPFGNDEGWDLVMEWGDRRDELGPDSSLTTVLGVDDLDQVRAFAGPMEGIDGLDTAQFIVGAAFTLLRLSGRIRDDDRTLALEALDFLIDTGGPEPEHLILKADLTSWRNPA
jgi:uncharacterized protein YfeS